MSFLDRVAQQAHWALRIPLAASFLFHGLSIFAMISEFAESNSLPFAVALLVPIAEVGGRCLSFLGGSWGELWAT